ncbi:MAG: GNAT family N-acetyltransferase [Lachnospiraceae bacterium]|nr:GNAT family N-acetyltransferase [Lachnospiraceae bacterium]
MNNNNLTLTTKRLTLKPMCMDYLESTHEYASDPENTTYMLMLPNDSIEETIGYLKGAEEEIKKDDPSFYEMAVFYEGKHIGAVSIYLDDERQSGEFGWLINKRYHGNGFAPEAAKALLDYSINTLGVRHFIAHCDSENIASKRVMEKLGFVLKDEYGGRKNKQSDEDRRECLYVYDAKA